MSRAARVLPALLVLSRPGSAQPQAQVETMSFIGEIMSIVLPLAFIILVLVAVLHFARRRYGMTAQDAPLSVLQILPMGPRERVILLKTRGGRLLVVGVAAHGVNLITELDPGDVAPAPGRTDVAEAARPSTVFGALLTRRDPSGRAGDPRR